MLFVPFRSPVEPVSEDERFENSDLDSCRLMLFESPDHDQIKTSNLGGGGELVNALGFGHALAAQGRDGR